MQCGINTTVFSATYVHITNNNNKVCIITQK